MDNTFTRKLSQDNYATEKIDVIKNNLLGTYDDDGKYIISSQIIKELIELPKKKKKIFDNSMFCVGNLLGYGEIDFELSFKNTTSGEEIASASLYLLENVDKINGYLQNTIKTLLEEFSDNLDNFIENTYSHFNISINDNNGNNDDEGMERKIVDDLNEDSFILAKKQYSLLFDKLTEDKLLDAYGKYFTYRFSALSKLNNEFANAVLDKFNEEYSLIEQIFLQDKNYKMLNELLDKCLEEVSGIKPEFVNQEKDFINKTSPALEDFINDVNKVSEKYSHKALDMLDKDDRLKMEEIMEETNNESTDKEERELDENKENVSPEELGAVRPTRQEDILKQEIVDETKNEIKVDKKQAEETNKDVEDKQQPLNEQKETKLQEKEIQEERQSPYRDKLSTISSIKKNLQDLNRSRDIESEPIQEGVSLEDKIQQSKAEVSALFNMVKKQGAEVTPQIDPFATPISASTDTPEPTPHSMDSIKEYIGRKYEETNEKNEPINESVDKTPTSDRGGATDYVMSTNEEVHNDNTIYKLLYEIDKPDDESQNQQAEQEVEPTGERTSYDHKDALESESVQEHSNDNVYGR